MEHKVDPVGETGPHAHAATVSPGDLHFAPRPTQIADCLPHFLGMVGVRIQAVAIPAVPVAPGRADAADS
eukprot:6459683-Alexandrium_andersonii.AAC.1